MVSTVIARVQGPQRRKAANMCSAACAIAAAARGVRVLDRSAGLPDDGFPRRDALCRRRARPRAMDQLGAKL